MGQNAPVASFHTSSFRPSGPALYIIRSSILSVNGIRVDLAHQSRTFGYPDLTLLFPRNPATEAHSSQSRTHSNTSEVPL